MARSAALVLAELRRRRTDLRGYRLGRCQAVYFREVLAAAIRNGDWSKLPGIFSCAAREGGALCLLDLIGRQLLARFADHWFYKLRRRRPSNEAIHPSLDAFWPMEGSISKPLPETPLGDTRPSAAAMPLKSAT